MSLAPFSSETFTTEQYQSQLAEKISRIQQQFAEFNPPELQVYPSEMDYFRMRAEFRIWHSDDGLFYAMFDKDEQGKKQVIRIDQFPIASRMIGDLMPKLLNELTKQPILSHKLFEINFLNSLAGEMLVTLLYHKALDEQWQNQTKQLQNKLNIKIIGRSRGQKIVLSDDFIHEQFHVHGRTYIYKQIENAFSQPNAGVCEKMLTWACDAAQDIQKNQQNQDNDLLELYCGNANFTLPLSHYFKNVLATEIAKSSVYAAQYNIERNQLHNIKIARLSAEEFTQAYTGEREFRRLQEQSLNLQDYHFSTIFVDPPRAGIDDATLKFMSQFKYIIYISCNLDTLYANLKQLQQSHNIQRFALFDQFPYTHHIECGVFLTLKS